MTTLTAGKPRTPEDREADRLRVAAAWARRTPEQHAADLKKRRQWQAAHKDEIAKRMRQWKAARPPEQDPERPKYRRSLEGAVHNGEPWCQADDQIILFSGQPTVMLAEILGRTIHGVRWRRQQLLKRARQAGGQDDE